MKTNALKHVREMFAKYDWTPAQRRMYSRKWVACIRRLGSNWLLAQKVERSLPQ